MNYETFSERNKSSRQNMENDALPFEEFIEETTELLDDLEALILKWETSRDDP